MGTFLPEPAKDTGLWKPTTTTAEGASSPEDIALMQRVLRAAARNPSLIPPDFMSYALDYMQVNRLTIPISQITGFSQFQAQMAAVDSITGESTPNQWVSLATDGPKIENLPDGQYIIMHGCFCVSSALGARAAQSVQLNSVSIGGSDFTRAANCDSADGLAIFTAFVAPLTNVKDTGNPNTIQCKYYGSGFSGNTGTFAYRRLISLKYA